MKRLCIALHRGRQASLKTLPALPTLLLLFALRPLKAEDPPREGWRVVPVPMLVGTSDVGWGPVGLLVATDNRKDYEPYRRQWTLAAARTNLGYEGVWLKMDSPQFPARSVRLSVELEYSRNLMANYRGYGNDIDLPGQQRITEGRSPSPTQRPASATLVEGGEASLATGCPSLPSLNQAAGGNPRCWNAGRRWLQESQNKFTAYDLTRRMAFAQLQGSFGPKQLKWQTGATLQQMHLLSYQGDREGGNTVPESPTLIDLDHPTGYDAVRSARFVNIYTLTMFYDSIPAAEEVHPLRGIRAGLRYEWAGPAAASDYRFDRTSLLINQYIPIGRTGAGPGESTGGTELILAWRGLVSSSRGDVPFFEEIGLGGRRLRGYPAQTFIDRVVASGSLELRWTAAHASGPGMDVILLGFVDEGRVARTGREVTVRDWHVAKGAGVGFLFDRNSLIEVVYGRSLYESYAELAIGHTFSLL